MASSKKFLDVDCDIEVPYLIATWREGAGWSQKQLALTLGISESRMSRMEHGKTPVTAVMFFKIAKILDRPVLLPCAK